MSLKGKKIVLYNDIFGKKFNTIKEAKDWAIKNNDDIKEYMFRKDFTVYINRQNDSEELFLGYVWKYYNIDTAEYIKINILSGYVFSQKTVTNNLYEFKNISDKYQINKYGSYKSTTTHKLPLKLINSVKKQFGNYKNISFFYLLAIAFAKNPNNYTTAKLYQNDNEVDTFFKEFNAERDIMWVPNEYQKNGNQINLSEYQVEYYTKEVEPEIEPIIVNKVISDYDSIKDTILEPWLPLKKYPKYEIDKRGHIRNFITKHNYSPNISTSYYAITLFPENERISIHRLVALTFLPSGNDNQNIVNHIDGNKLNNNVDNLEWVSYKENNDHNCKVLHPNRPIEPMREAVKATINIESFEKTIKYQLGTITNTLSGITISDNKIMVNSYIYKNDLQFESVSSANRYFEKLGFPKCNAISHNITIDKSAYGYQWSHVNAHTSNSSEEWKIVSKIDCPMYDLSKCTNYEVSSHGRFRKNNYRITDPATFKFGNYSISISIGGSKKEYKVNFIVACAFIGLGPSGYVVHHIDLNKQNYHYTNLCWKTIGEIQQILRKK